MGNWERLVWNQRDALLSGLAVTVEVCVIAFTCAILGGLFLCLVRLYVRPLRIIAIGLIEFFRATPILVQLLLYASPVAYSVQAVPERLRPYFLLNPLSATLDGFRWSLLGTAPPSAGGVAWAVAGAAIALTVGSLVFAKFERRLADVI